MSTDLARARAASVLDVLGDDFWAWWRTCMGLGLLALLLALVMAASLDAGLQADVAMLVHLLATATFATCMATVAYVATKRLHRWRLFGTLRRLPVAHPAPRWDAVGLLLMATLAWIVLANWAFLSATSTDVDGWTPAPWVVLVLAVTAGSAAFGRWEKSVWSQALATLLLFYVYLRMNSIAQTAVGLTKAQLSGMAATSALLLVWSLLPARARSKGIPSPAPWTWRIAMPLEHPRRAWFRERFDAGLRVLPVWATGGAILMGPFVEGKTSPPEAWLWLTYQVLVVGFTALYWRAPEQHWRWRLSPRFARQRTWLALRLWWTQCRWAIPLGSAAALLTSTWLLRLPAEINSIEACRLAATALPWLIANIALLMALVTLWVGMRRRHVAWDGVLMVVCAGVFVTSRWDGTYLTEHRIDWSGRVELLGAMLAATALLLAVATWVWQRGSLTGMERWSAVGRLRKR